MGLLVVSTATLECSCGSVPGVLSAGGDPAHNVLADGLPLAVVTDIAPMKNISSFGLCNSLANPTVASATTAAQGVLTPMPCIPAPRGPWSPPANVVVGIAHIPAVDENCTCDCMWQGTIFVIEPGQTAAADLR